jgi:hypothetical protein
LWPDARGRQPVALFRQILICSSPSRATRLPAVTPERMDHATHGQDVGTWNEWRPSLGGIEPDGGQPRRGSGACKQIVIIDADIHEQHLRRSRGIIDRFASDCSFS